MSEIYPFKRSFYYEVEQAIHESSVTFILGARRCGKTVCMKQLQDTFSETNTFDKVVYFDAKREKSTIQKELFMKQVLASIEAKEKALYLIDETTYLNMPDTTIMEVQDAFTSFSNENTKIVFTGSQSKALEYWGHRAFAGDAVFIRPEFLSYPEWLAWKGISEISADTYEVFIKGTREFYKNFRSTKEYLQGCLDETINSNVKSSEMIYGNDCFGLTSEMLLDVLYASLLTLHNHIKYERFVNPNVLQNTIAHYFSKQVLEIGEENLENRIAELLAERYHNFSHMHTEQLLNALQFLEQCDFITIAPVTDVLEIDPYYQDNLFSGNFKSKSSIMNELNVCIKYPMFYVDIVKSLLMEHMPEILPTPLLGSIVECHVRGLLPKQGGIEYHSQNDAEIDYVNPAKKKAIEITISNKRIRNTNFDILPEGYYRILLSNHKKEISHGIEFVPYYQFIYDNSVGKDVAYPFTHVPFSPSDENFIVTPAFYGDSIIKQDGSIGNCD